MANRRMTALVWQGILLMVLGALAIILFSGAPVLMVHAQGTCTATTASQLANCIDVANANGAGLDVITLGANIHGGMKYHPCAGYLCRPTVIFRLYQV